MDSMCRTCGETLNLILAKNIYGRVQNARRLIESVISCKLKNRTSLPKFICLRCQQDVCRIATFRERCLKAQIYFNCQRKKLRRSDPLLIANEPSDDDGSVNPSDEHNINYDEVQETLNEVAENVITQTNTKEISSIALQQTDNVCQEYDDAKEQSVSHSLDNIELQITARHTPKSVEINTYEELEDIIEYDYENAATLEDCDSIIEQTAELTETDTEYQDTEMISIDETAKTIGNNEYEVQICNVEENYHNDDNGNNNDDFRESYIDEESSCTREFLVRTKSKKCNEHRRINYICEYCGTTWADLTNFKMHMFRHTGTKNFKCTQCNLAFYTNFLLKRHEQTHFRSLACNYCDKKFRYTCALRRHERVHLNVRPFKCQYCPKDFYDSSSCKNHEILHVGDRKFQCEVCDMWFMNRKYLKTHLASKNHKRNEQKPKNT